MSSMASAPNAAVSWTWYSSTMNSLRSTGTETQRRRATRSSSLPWKNRWSVNTDMAEAPWAA